MRGRLRRRGRDVISPVSNGGLGGMWSFLPPPSPPPSSRSLSSSEVVPWGISAGAVRSVTFHLLLLRNPRVRSLASVGLCLSVCRGPCLYLVVSVRVCPSFFCLSFYVYVCVSVIVASVCPCVCGSMCLYVCAFVWVRTCMSVYACVFFFSFFFLSFI